MVIQNSCLLIYCHHGIDLTNVILRLLPCTPIFELKLFGCCWRQACSGLVICTGICHKKFGALLLHPGFQRSSESYRVLKGTCENHFQHLPTSWNIVQNKKHTTSYLLMGYDDISESLSKHKQTIANPHHMSHLIHTDPRKELAALIQCLCGQHGSFFHSQRCDEFPFQRFLLKLAGVTKLRHVSAVGAINWILVRVTDCHQV